MSVVINVLLLFKMLIAGEAVYIGAGSIWELSVLSTRFCYEPKIAQKKLYLKGEKSTMKKLLNIKLF